MWKYFRALIRSFTGLFSSQYNALQSNENVIEATFDAAISKGQNRQKHVTDAVASLMTACNQRLAQIKDLNEQLTKHTKLQVGAKVLMQKCIDAGRAAGKTKEEIEKDPEYIKGYGWFKDATSSIKLITDQVADKENDVKERQAQIAKYKVELQAMQRNNAKLVDEKDSTKADVAIAKQQVLINNTLAGISEDTTDQDLAAVRKARMDMQSKAQISAELTSNNAVLAEQELLQLANSSEADKELDGLLNWGDETPATKLEDAKLAE